MEATQIIQKVAQNAGVDPRAALQAAHQALSEGMKIINVGDTLTFYRPLGNGSFHVHFASASMQPMAVVGEIKAILQQLKAMGAQVLYMNSESKNIMGALQANGAQVSKSNVPKFQLMVML